MSFSAYAKRRGLTGMAVTIAVQTGRLKECIVLDAKGKKKIGDPELADREWDANTNFTRAPEHAKAAATTLAESDELETITMGNASLAEKHWRAKLMKLKYDEAAKELVPKKDVVQGMADVFRACRTKLLALPSRVRQQLPHLTVQDIATIKGLVREALEELGNE